MNLDSIVPWGRSYDEYRSIFSLTDADLKKRILGCGDGLACFNTELTKRGGNIVSIDPIYQFTSEQIESRIAEVYSQVISQMNQNTENYIWESIKSVTALGSIREAAMKTFLSDYHKGLREGRYLCASLPRLPFTDQQFDLALCSHYLFLYSEHFTLVQHIEGLKELCRVATEVRVYPLPSLDNKYSNHLTKVIEVLDGYGITSSIKPVNYRFQRGATEMLVLSSVNL